MADHPVRVLRVRDLLGGSGAHRPAAVAPWALGLTGAIYGVASIALNAVFLLLAFMVLGNRATEPAGMKPEKRLFAYSILYLFALFGALVADRWVFA